MHKQELIAKALEISISLTKADHTWLRTDDRGFVFVKEPLFTTWNTVIRAMSAIKDLDPDGDCRVFPEG